MFIAFDSSQSGEEGLSNPKRPKRNGRIGRGGLIVRACTSCRRRKVKCTGDKPCESCRWYKKPQLCSYPERRKSRSHSENSGTSSNQYRTTLEKLFPDTTPEDIVDLPREALAQLMMNESDSQSGQNRDSPTVAASIHPHGSSVLSLGQPVLESLHSMPEEEGDLDSSQCTSRFDSLEQISDDVNALSLTTRQTASYLGISSTQAALKVIAWLLPQSRPFASSYTFPRDHSARMVNPIPSLSTQSSLVAPTEAEILDAYFVDFHILAPLLDEKSFRATHLAGKRTDHRWLALLNIVLALGSIATSGPDSHAHRKYFDRSMNLLNLATLGTPTTETAQTLGLIGGWYCHYISKPNLGYSLIGVALRMAVSLGLQREPYDSHLVLEPARAAQQEYKRRVWWALCCLETWGHETLGRASMDFFAPTITVSRPRLLDEENYLEILPLIENVEFIRIASKIQEALASVEMLSYSETSDLDAQLLQWWENLPPALKDYEPCPESLYTARTVMRWRLHNQRILLYRPKLLTFAMRKVPFMTIRADERDAILKCREIAEINIQDICMATRLNHMIGWNAVWFLFQASMVPLIYLSTRPRNEDSIVSFDSCKTQVETAILAFDRIKPYGYTAERSLEVISGILEACLARTATETPDTTTNGFTFQNIPLVNAFDSCIPAAQGQSWDWNAMSLESLPPQLMWEYLSWGPEDFRLGMSEIGLQNEEYFMDQPLVGEDS